MNKSLLLVLVFVLSACGADNPSESEFVPQRFVSVDRDVLEDGLLALAGIWEVFVRADSGRFLEERYLFIDASGEVQLLERRDSAQTQSSECFAVLFSELYVQRDGTLFERFTADGSISLGSLELQVIDETLLFTEIGLSSRDFEFPISELRISDLRPLCVS